MKCVNDTETWQLAAQMRLVKFHSCVSQNIILEVTDSRWTGASSTVTCLKTQQRPDSGWVHVMAAAGWGKKMLK